MNTMIRLLIAAAVIGLAGAMLFPRTAHGQVTDPPITNPLAWVGRVVDVQAARACVAGWRRDTDRYGDYIRAMAFVDFSRLTATQIAAISAAFSNNDLAALATLRTVNVRDDPAVAPCLAKLNTPPPTWVVASISSGKRPAYLLGADGKRAAQSGTADVKLPNGEPMPCRCKTRSVETTSSTYCSWMMADQEIGGQKRVTLCRENK